MSELRFDRIGRHHHVPPLTLPDGLTDDAIADAAIKYASKYLGSKDVSIAVGVTTSGRITGEIYCGFRNGGSFTGEGGAS